MIDGLYDMLAARRHGLRDLAAARLRYTVLSAIQKAFLSSGLSEKELSKKAGMRVRRVRRILHGDGDVEPSTVAELLHAMGYEADIHIVPSRRASQAGVARVTEDLPIIGVGMPAMLKLEAFAGRIADAYGEPPFLVGSAAVGKVWRDVDVRLIVDDDVFAAMFPDHRKPSRLDLRWALLCDAISELGRQQTGLPIDFQIQAQSAANELFGGEVRHPLGLRITD